MCRMLCWFAFLIGKGRGKGRLSSSLLKDICTLIHICVGVCARTLNKDVTQGFNSRQIAGLLVGEAPCSQI